MYMEWIFGRTVLYSVDMEYKTVRPKIHSLVFHVNGKRNFVYPRIETEQEGQFPFNIPQYLLIDMQLGGSWVGTVDPADLPVEMEVDWVRHYQWK